MVYATPVIDMQDLRNRPDVYKKTVTNKGLSVDVDALLALDEKRKTLLPDVESMRAEKNEVSKKVPTLEGAEKDTAIAEMQKLKETLDAKEEELKTVEQQWSRTQLELPSIPLETVPVGKGEEDNVEVKTWGEPKKAADGDKDHVELGEALDIVDIPRGVKVAGSRSYFLKGDGARLEMAVLHFAIDSLLEKGWTLFTPPLMANYDCFVGTGFFPGVDQNNIYAVGGQEEEGGPIESDGVYLVGTSEVSVASYHKDELLKAEDLPKKYCGYSPCFRREAGTYGKDTHGLYRIHQFQKVEQVVLCEANQEQALELHEEIRTNAEDVLQALELPYRVVDCCTGDMGKSKVYMQDIETWMPSRDAYGETHSCSYLGDFQARRLNIKYEDSSGEKQFVHTLNNTCIATPRVLIPILEVYQNADGTVTVPEVLRKYMGGKDTIG